jgi:hypothetical protein
VGQPASTVLGILVLAVRGCLETIAFIPSPMLPGKWQAPTHICATIGVTDTNIVMGCQDLITATSDPGDSGSPVFEITHTPATNDVRAVGILWGGGVIDGVEVSVITPTPFVRDVITGPGLCAPGFSC